MRATIIVLALILSGCSQAGVSPGRPANGSAGPATSSAGPATSSAGPAAIPPGVIAFMRVDAGEIERYFTVHTDGSNEHALYETRHCACIRWSPDAGQIWTVTETDEGLSFTTMNADGSDRVEHASPIPALFVIPGPAAADGRTVTFLGIDESDPSRTGLYVGSPDLSDFRFVTGLPDGILGLDPIGMSADGSHIYFHGDLGENHDNGFHHAGNVYVVATDGTGLRQLNPKGTKTEITGTGLSADGRRFAFTAWKAGDGAAGNALFVVDGPAGEAEQVTDFGGLWGATWSPTGEWIGYTDAAGDGAVISLIKPDGSGTKAVVPEETSVGTIGPAWSPSGEHLLVRRGTQAANELWIMDLDGKLITQVTHKAGRHDVYSWALPRD